MQKEITISVSPKAATDDNLIKFSAAKKMNINVNNISDIRVIKRSIDARSRKINIHLKIIVYTSGEFAINNDYKTKYQNVSSSTPIIIVGCGPAGLLQHFD